MLGQTHGWAAYPDRGPEDPTQARAWGRLGHVYDLGA